MSTLLYPTANELMFINQQFLPQKMQGNPIFDILPPVSKNTPLLTWEQEDNYFGLMQLRGYNGSPIRVNPVALKQYQMQPGVYGEEMVIDEQEVTIRRRYGSFNEPVDVQDLVVARGLQLMSRQIARQSYLGWQLLVNGYFEVVNNLSQSLSHIDSYVQRVFTATVSWSTIATATPLQDFRNVELFSRGYSIDLGSTAKAYMNRVTFNNFIANTNSQDLYGRRTEGLGTVLSLPMANALLQGENLPTIVVYDGGFLDDTNTWQPFIPVNRVLVVGSRLDGSRLGEWIFTTNAVNANMEAGPSYRVWQDPNIIPPTVKVYRGFNGGHALYFPSGFVIMSVG